MLNLFIFILNEMGITSIKAVRSICLVLRTLVISLEVERSLAEKLWRLTV